MAKIADFDGSMNGHIDDNFGCFVADKDVENLRFLLADDWEKSLKVCLFGCCKKSQNELIFMLYLIGFLSDILMVWMLIKSVKKLDFDAVMKSENDSNFVGLVGRSTWSI